MTKILLLLTLALSAVSAHAAQPVQAMLMHNSFTFTVPSVTDDGTEVYYNVDALEQTTQDVLKQMGATNVMVNVDGFANDVVFFPSVTVSFDSLHAAGTAGQTRNAEWRKVTVQSDSGFELQSIFAGVKDHFELQNLKASTSGFGSNFSARYEFTTLFAQ